MASAGASRRRADFAIDQAQDVRDEAQALVDAIDEALLDDTLTPEEVREIVSRAKRVFREAEEVVVATEWTSVGELGAVAKLTGRGSANAEIRELDVQRRASEIGFVLSTV